MNLKLLADKIDEKGWKTTPTGIKQPQSCMLSTSKFSIIHPSLHSKRDLRSTSYAVIRFLASLTSIFLTRSFALSEILGQGSDVKSRSPCKTSSNISCSVSISKAQIDRIV